MTAGRKSILLVSFAAVAAVNLAMVSVPVGAAGLASGKVCTVVRSCNFKRSAAVRGCLSSYSCRQCDFRRVATSRNGRVEFRSSCGWGVGS
jgi:hypothetical protein